MAGALTPDELAVEKAVWIDDEMASALDAGCFNDENDPELLAYAERGWERDLVERLGL